MDERNQQVIEYLQSLCIKTTPFGGFDKIEVFEALKELSNIYEDILEREREILMREMNGLNRQLRGEIRKADEYRAEKEELGQKLAEMQRMRQNTPFEKPGESEQFSSDKEKSHKWDCVGEETKRIVEQAQIDALRKRSEIVREKTDYFEEESCDFQNVVDWDAEYANIGKVLGI